MNTPDQNLSGLQQCVTGKIASLNWKGLTWMALVELHGQSRSAVRRRPASANEKWSLR